MPLEDGAAGSWSPRTATPESTWRSRRPARLPVAPEGDRSRDRQEPGRAPDAGARTPRAPADDAERTPTGAGRRRPRRSADAGAADAAATRRSGADAHARWWSAPGSAASPRPARWPAPAGRSPCSSAPTGSAAAGAALLIWPNGVGRAARARPRRRAGRDRHPDAAAASAGPDGRWLVQPRGHARPTGRPGGGARARTCTTRSMAGLGDRVEIRTGVEVPRSAPARRAAGGRHGRHTFEADLVVAADGIDSLIRRRLAPESRGASAPATPPGGR